MGPFKIEPCSVMMGWPGRICNLHGSTHLWLRCNFPHRPYFCCNMKRYTGRHRSPSPHTRGLQSPRQFLPQADKTYIAFNKPFNVVSQFTPPHEGARTLAEFGFPPEVYPVGRLDQDSEGLLLLTDDATLNHTLLHPARRHTKSYLALVEGIPSDDALRQLSAGVMVQGKRTLPALAQRIQPPELEPRAVRYRAAIPTSWLRLIITEGRNRQVRRMTAAVGHPTLRLFREAIGSLSIGMLGLQPGQWRTLQHPELQQLFLPDAATSLG